MKRYQLFVGFGALTVTIAFSLVTTAAQFAVTQSPDIDLKDVNIFPVQGTVSLLVGPGGLDSTSANVTVQTSDDAVVLVDTGRGDQNDRYLTAIRKISRKPVRFIINTQAAQDHVGGNETLARSGRPFGGRAAGAGFLLPDQDSGATIIAHENALKAMSAPSREPALPFPAWPSETYFTDEHELFNGEAIQLFHAAGITNGDSLVFFRRSDVISAGDIFSTQSYPKINRSAGGTIDGEIAALNQILDLAVPREKQEGGTYIIPGHGRVCDEADVVEYRDMLVIIRDRVANLRNKGQSLEQVKAAKTSFDYDRRYATRDLTADQFIETIYATLPAVSRTGQPTQPPNRSQAPAPRPTR
jgi:glyoxylase-like metal-dependent hydrolase (beta-lactamase superfamily II)